MLIWFEIHFQASFIQMAVSCCYTRACPGIFNSSCINIEKLGHEYISKSVLCIMHWELIKLHLVGLRTIIYNSKSKLSITYILNFELALGI